MQGTDFLFPEDIYKKHLSFIKGVSFTRREIDVVACFIHLQGGKKTASLLSISPHTVWTYVRNIMSKVGCNSRQGIIDFVERSPQLPWIKKHYAALIRYSVFEKMLKNIAKLNTKHDYSCLIFYEGNQVHKNLFVTRLKNHLKQADFHAILYAQAESFKIETLKDKSQILFLILEKEDWEKAPKELLKVGDSIDISKQRNYYLAVFEILKKLLPDANLKSQLVSFIEQSKRMRNISENHSPQNKENEELEKCEKNIYKKIKLFKHKKIYWIFSIACVFLFLLVFQLIKWNKEMQVAHINKISIKSSIRSDLIIPTETALLHRPEELSQINEKFKRQSGVQTVALVGPGGAGKTTLARQFVHNQKADVIWEINAETPESLTSSFENLARALAKTENDQKILRGFQEINDPIKREEKFIEFVKEHLRTFSSWALIFDNMEKFTDIQKHFPQDAKTWGQGKIILTTRDSTIQNNKHIHSTLQIGELTPVQKLTLFTKIMANGDESAFPSEKKEEANQFLEKMPPYPLDVSVAAYYLKTANISYETYIKNLAQYNKDFEGVQESLLKESGDYTKTRYGIITLSLQRFINTNKDFGDLMLIISLLDSQNIPRDLLDNYKNNVIVDNFIYNLKKYSLITGESSLPSLGQTISLHRSTQSLSLAYLIKALTIKMRKDLLHSAQNILSSYAEDAIYKEDLPKMELLVSHLGSFLNHDDLINDVLKGTLGSKLGFIYNHLCYHNKSEVILEKSFKLLNRDPIRNNTHLMNILIYLAKVNMELGHFEKTKELMDNCLKDYKNYFTESNVSVARGLTAMGYLYGVLGEYEKAKNMLEQSLSIYNKHLPQHYVGGAQTTAYLGNIYWFMGNYEKARTFLENSLAMYKEFFPDKYLNIAVFHTFLGNVYIALGEYEKAKYFLEKGLTIYKKQLPETHPWVAWASLYVGQVYEELGKYSDALPILEKSLSINIEAFGERNVRSAWAMYYLGKLYVKLGNISEAKSLFEKTLLVYEKEYGKNHVETARAWRVFGEASLAEGSLETAEDSLQKALQIVQESNHTDSHMVLEDLGQLYLTKSKLAENQGNIKEIKKYEKQGIDFFKQALDVVKTRFPENSPHTKRIQSKLETL